MPQTALFVIDIQHDLCGDPSSEIPSASKLKAAGTSILAKARAVIASARKAGKEPSLTLVFVQHEEAPDKGPLVRGSEAWQLYFKSNEESKDERLVAKDVGDTFISNPSLASELKGQGVTDIVAFGIQSDCCVRATVKGALNEGFNVTLLEGAHGTYDEGGKTAEEIAKDVEKELEGLGTKLLNWESWEA